MKGNSSQQIKDFFKKTKTSVAKTQAKMVETAMEDLFEKSPYKGRPGSKFSESEYDANHKVKINNELVSPHNPQTHSRGVSFAIHYVEKEKANQLKSGDRVEVFNTTLHNKEVEYGGPTWQRPGYYVYQQAMFNLMRDYQNVTR